MVAKPPAQRAAEYRARRKEAGLSVSRGARTSRGPKKSAFQRGKFIALDGEGESFGPVERFIVGKDKAVYEAQDHKYTLLAASTGAYLYRGNERLRSGECIDFLLDLARDNRKAIFVIFAGGYDVNHILRDFSREDLKKISKGHEHQWEAGGEKYSLTYRARKSLRLKRGYSYDPATKKAKWRDAMTIWDVWGFFQDSFVGVMEKWLGAEWKHYSLIKQMKAQRGDFANVEHARIIEYNNAELETLVAVMQKVHEALEGLGLTCKRWDGAGAVAAAMFQQHKTKEYKQVTDDEIIDAVRTAYAGGRIEICKMGDYSGPVYDYDINSAYPFAMHDLPCLAHGAWEYGEGEPPEGFTLVRIQWRFQEGLPFYPLWFRTDKMAILYPSQGEGWYWWPEWQAAQDCLGMVEAIEWYRFVPACTHKPFSWIKDYYHTRQRWVKSPSHEWQRGGEKIIKLGLNSLYGKTAQQLGGRIDAIPPFHQMEWAGWITSATRARLYRAAMTNPDAVIGFATDGIFSSEPLNIELSDKKDFGAWELKTPVPCGMTVVQAGVYWWHYGNGTYSHFSRGFDKDAMLTPAHILESWKKGEYQLSIPLRRLIGIGTACASDSFWKMYGRFTLGYRTLKLNGYNSKREPVDVKKTKPYKNLVFLEPTVNYALDYQEISAPYPLEWLNEALEEDYTNELELMRELEDTFNI